MKYIHFFGNAGFCGTDYHEFMEFEDDTPDDVIGDLSDGFAHDNAESYEYCATGWGDEFASEEDEEEYYENAANCCGWEELSKKDYEDLKEMYS